MEVKLKYFGMIAEITNCTDELFPFDGNTLEDLKNRIEEKYPSIQSKTYQFALNQSLSNLESKVRNGDEIAFLPPFAGG